jgi:hypothetical protein
MGLRWTRRLEVMRGMCLGRLCKGRKGEEEGVLGGDERVGLFVLSRFGTGLFCCLWWMEDNTILF